jgi:peptidoglycan-associated lipoprotein
MRLRTALIGLTTTTLIACGGSPPKASLTEAQTALDGAVLAKKCAPEDYAAAERMFMKAQTLSEKGKYDEAKQAAEAAKKLAFQARKKAEARRAECFAPKDKNTVDVDQFVDRSQPDVVVGAEVDGMKTVYFDYNAFELSPEARQTLTQNAAWMNGNAGSTIIIEGHCDSRGSSEYNLALGEKRGQVALRYLKQLGVDTNRVQVTSYGEERPADYGEGEAAFARNRRVEFTVR